jgi:hypothetical protein
MAELQILIPVLLQASLLFIISRLLFVTVISATADRRGRGCLVAFLRVPGNLVHEYSHCLGFWLCGYRVKRVILFIFDPQGRGSCSPGRPWSPVASPWLATGLAALMPLVVGSTLLVGCARWLGVLTTPAVIPPQAFIPALWHQAVALFYSLDWHRWQTYLFLYLALSIGAELSPSTTDLRYGLPALLGVGAGLLVGFYTLDQSPRLHDLYTTVTVALTHVGNWILEVQGLALILTSATLLLTLLPAMALRFLRR